MSGFADLVHNDDLDVGMDPENYQDPVGFAPPAPGNYRGIVLEAAPKTTKDGKAIYEDRDQKYPIISLKKVSIVEPDELKRDFFPFFDVKTRPYERYGVVVSGLGDITRAFDATRAWRGLSEGLALLDEYIQARSTFSFGLGWSAYDKDFVDATLEELGFKDVHTSELNDADKKTVDAVYKKARLRTKDFPVVNGRRIHVVKGPSGNNLEARATIERFYPSTEVVNFGAFKVRAA